MSAIMQRNALDNNNEVEFKSLNRTARKQELQKITKENQAILTRIQQRKPAYSTRTWEKDFKQSRTYLTNIRTVKDSRAPVRKQGKSVFATLGGSAQTPKPSRPGHNDDDQLDDY
jgi:hypothetical protein